MLLKTHNGHWGVLRVMMWKHRVIILPVVGAEKCISSHVAVVWCTGMQQIAMETYCISWKLQLCYRNVIDLFYDKLSYKTFSNVG